MIDANDRKVTVLARQKKKKQGPALAPKIAKRRVLTGKTSGLFGQAAAL